MTTELKYDPELPYAIEMQPGLIWARFRVEGDAHDFVERESGVVVDTTPKPKIPEDAEFVMWTNEDDYDCYARRIEGDWRDDEGMTHSEEGLTSWIGDAQVTVLVRKEEP